jgi:hypothetical protein
MQHCGCEVSLAVSVGTIKEPVSSSAGSTTTSTSTTSGNVQRRSQLLAASQHNPLPVEPLLTSAFSKAGTDGCGSRCSTSSNQQLSTTTSTSTTSGNVQRRRQLLAASQHNPLPDEPLLTSAFSKAGSDGCGSRCSTSSNQQLSTTTTTSTTSGNVQRRGQLLAASQHNPLPDELLLTSAFSKAGSDDCGSSFSTSSNQQLFAQADHHPKDQQMECAPANNPGSTISFLQQDGRCSSSSGPRTDDAATEPPQARDGSDAVVIETVKQHMSHQASNELQQQHSDTVLQGASTNKQHRQAMQLEADQHAVLQLWQQQVEAAAAAAHTALQAYQQQQLQLVPQAGAMKPQDMLKAEQQCWVQHTAGGPVSHPIVLDDVEDQWVWTEQSTQLLFCRTQLQTAVAVINRLLSAGC